MIISSAVCESGTGSTEATTSAVHRAALKGDGARLTALTNLFKGRPARGIVNRLMRELGPMNSAVPAFPLYMQGPEIIEDKMVTTGDLLCFTFICNLTGQPAATIPAGFTKDGLPVGMQIIGRHLADRTVLAASGAFEQARPWAHTWPKLLGDLGL